MKLLWNLLNYDLFTGLRFERLGKKVSKCSNHAVGLFR